MAAAGAADITIAADCSIVRPQPEFAKKKSSTSASGRSAAQAALHVYSETGVRTLVTIMSLANVVLRHRPRYRDERQIHHVWQCWSCACSFATIVEIRNANLEDNMSRSLMVA